MGTGAPRGPHHGIAYPQGPQDSADHILRARMIRSRHNALYGHERAQQHRHVQATQPVRSSPRRAGGARAATAAVSSLGKRHQRAGQHPRRATASQSPASQPGQDRAAVRGSGSQPVHPPPRLRIQPRSRPPPHHRHPPTPPGRPTARPHPGLGQTPGDARRAGPGRAGEQRRERRAAPGPSGPRDDAGPTTRRVTSPAPARAAFQAAARWAARMHDPHVTNREWLTGWFWSVISSMPGLPPPGAPGCSPSATWPGNYEGAGSSNSPASTASTLSKTSPNVSMRLISPYSDAVSPPPVRNQVAPRASHSSTSSNSARTRSLATPRILISYTRGRFVTSPALSWLRSRPRPLSAAGAARASPTDHPRQGEPDGACPRGCGVPGRPAAQSHQDRRGHVRPSAGWSLSPARRGTVTRCSGLPCSEGSSPLAGRWCSWWLPPASARPACSSNGPRRQTRRMAVLR
jgi:hypothetical protein